MRSSTLIVIGALLLFPLSVGGVGAYPFPVTVTQPDGSSFTFLIHGDEEQAYKTSLDGRRVIQGSDGFYRYDDACPSEYVRKTPVAAWSGLLTRTRSTGTVKSIVVPVQFSDRHFTTPNIKSAIYNLFNQLNYSENGATGSVKDYFRDNLGVYDFIFDVADPVTLGRPSSYYGENVGGVIDYRIREMVKDACSVAYEQGVCFRNYDYDSDGKVDNVFFFFSGHNEAEGGGDCCIWPQSWDVTDMDVRYDGVKIGGFSLYSEFSGAQGKEFAGIGSICHEYCHILGLKDMYDVNGDLEGLSHGLGGTLSIMDYGNYNNQGKTPPYLTVFEREMLGTVGKAAVKVGKSLLIEPVQESSEVYFVSTAVAGEEYYLEYRDGTKWDKYIGGTGLVIYHIDKSSNVAGSMSAAMRWKSNAVNACSSHPCADCILCSDQFVDASDIFFPGKNGRTIVHSSASEPLWTWSSSGLGVGLTDMIQGAGGFSVMPARDDGWSFPVVSDYYVIPEQTTATLIWTADKKGKGVWNITLQGQSSAESSSFTVRTSTRFEFVGLVPDEEYSVILRYSQSGIVGRPFPLHFRTIRRLNDFPLIGGLDRKFSAGDSLRLDVLNLSESVDSIRWFINGMEYSGQFLELGAAGRFRIEAVIRYSDDTEERLTKLLDVSEKN